ncbi:MAG: DUF349 domain-containing protein [Cyclobacteriaceae bacterium]
MEQEQELQAGPLEMVVAGSTKAPAASHEPEVEVEADEWKSIDFAAMAKKDFVTLLKELTKETDVRKIDFVLRESRHHFDELRDRSRAEALFRFQAEGGLPDDFDYRPDDVDIAFDATYRLLRDKRNQFFKNQELQRAENLYKKQQLLEQLRHLVDGEDSGAGFNAFKNIQQEWKGTGPVGPAHARELWASYHALVDRFYDHRNIYFELKELDRKKNLVAKIELCERAEQLAKVDSIREAVKELNELHEEFRHIGPVPAEDKEALWTRFKAASDGVYARRDAHVEELQKQLGANLQAKEQVVTEVAAFTTFQSDRIKDWNQKTQEILALQKKWESIGAVPRAKTKDINRKFWAAFKSFFNNKSGFFKKLDSERDANLKSKQALVDRARQLQDSQDWESTSNELKQLQVQWKEIGPVPEKQREKIFQEFKEACDKFFGQRRGLKEQEEAGFEENLKRKQEICDQLTKHAVEKSGSLDRLHELQAQFNEIGFVPRKSMAAIRQRYNQAVEHFMNSLEGVSEKDKQKFRLEVELDGLRGDPQGGRKLQHKEQHLRKRISKAENDLATLRNNLEFFGRSKNADKVRAEFSEKIRLASEELDAMRAELKILRSVG